MNLKEKLAALQKELRDIQSKAAAEKRDFTDDELTEIETKAAEVSELKARLERIAKSEQALADLVELGKSDDSAEDVPEDLASVPLGERFTKSGSYQTFQKQFPSGAIGAGTPVKIDSVRIGSMKDFFANRRNAKAVLTTDVARLQPIRVPTVDLVQRPKLTLLDLISRGQTGGSFEYVQITAVTRNAAIVPEATSADDDAALKPVSDLTTALADAKVFTYADGFDVTNSLLADAPAFASYLENELEYSLDSVVEDYLLNGTGADGQPKGVLHTSGVQSQAIASDAPMDLVKAARRGITKVTRLQGGTVTAVLLSPEDDEEIDLLQDGNERFYGQGPFGSGPQTLWGRPRAVSERLEKGQFILGDFRQIALLDREGLAVQAFNQHKDYAQRNLTYVRAELRAAQVIWKPAYLVVGEVGGEG
ncbi:phage major capsid protein [Agromyces larvae]|uniref:Phage major capsid protein n=1 Tax=Agromyces larvae TaxID=2929802 RepID=A0ABY4C3A7_9MICO|nr:phage major capsid protein [Agromyces larvae]UOE45479.1 phage major capsid protein [Agromyces larvae]